MNTARIAAIAARLFAWGKRRAAERSTWLGLASAAGALGYSTIDLKLTALADVLPMLIGGGGLVLAAASTSPRPNQTQPLPGGNASTTS